MLNILFLYVVEQRGVQYNLMTFSEGMSQRCQPGVWNYTL